MLASGFPAAAGRSLPDFRHGWRKNDVIRAIESSMKQPFETNVVRVREKDLTVDQFKRSGSAAETPSRVTHGQDSGISDDVCSKEEP